MAKEESPTQPTLDIPPRKSIDDPGAHDLESDEDDHFSDAHSGRSNAASPIPTLRVEKIDDEPSYGEVPGTEAYKKREQDAEPDIIAVMSPIRRSETGSPSTPGGQPIPTTLVEKVDETPSYGEVPGTLAHRQHAADAVPDFVVRSDSHSRSNSIRSRANSTRSRANSTPGDLPIPITRVERVDSAPRHGEVPGTEAYELRKGDAKPDEEAEVEDVPGRHISTSHTSEPLTGPGSPTLPEPRSPSMSHARRESSLGGATDTVKESALDEYNEEEDGSETGFGDDFDDFEEGEEDAEFGDFDDGFQEAETVVSPPPQSIPITPAFPVLDFSELKSSDQIQAATEPYINALFPPETIETSVLPTPSPSQNPIFLTPRSASLWTQLVAPPPLQPPNWIRSRIRRLFLVSLGVPVDLDEILPASKQKKLILPSIHLHPNNSSTSPRTSTDSRSITRLKAGSSTSLDSSGNAKPSRSDSRRRKGPPPAPSLDLVWARQVCSITPAAMNGLTMEELQEHVGKLEGMVGTAKEVLEYWTKKTDELLGDREAFEGVIENLVKHARKTRK